MAAEQFSVRLLTHDIVEVILKKHVDLDISITDAIDAELERLAPGRKVRQLVIAPGPYIVNPEMRNSFAKGDTGIKQIAIAWVSPDKRANDEQEAILSKLPTPVPIRFFSDREKGIAWLKSLAGK
jgi:hypothetical protein